MDAGWQRVGQRVDAERVRRGHRSLASFAKSAGVGKSTVDNIVHARKNAYDPATIALVERALGWQDGAIDRIRRGMGPIYDHDPELTALLDVWSRLNPQARRLLRLYAEDAARADELN